MTADVESTQPTGDVRAGGSVIRLTSLAANSGKRRT